MISLKKSVGFPLWCRVESNVSYFARRLTIFFFFSLSNTLLVFPLGFLIDTHVYQNIYCKHITP